MTDRRRLAGQFAHDVVEHFKEKYGPEKDMALKFGDVGNGEVKPGYSREIFLNLITGSRAHTIDKNNKRILTGCFYNGEYPDGIERVNFFHPADWANKLIKNIILYSRENENNIIASPVHSIDFHNKRNPGEILIAYSYPFFRW